MEPPSLCPAEGHSNGRRDVRETIWNSNLFTTAAILGLRASTLSHKHHLLYLKCSFCTKWKGKAFFQTKQLCHGTQLDVTYDGELKYSKCSVLKTNDIIDLEICKYIYF
ncbi:hypothetical protein ACROYT_G041986 [Oculina patagonica]